VRRRRVGADTLPVGYRAFVMDLQVRHERIGTHGVVHLSGDVDLATLPRLGDALSRAIDQSAGAATVIVDLDGVVILDDAALGLLLGAAGRLRAMSGDLVVACSAPGLRQRLALTGFDRAVRVVDRLSAVATA